MSKELLLITAVIGGVLMIAAAALDSPSTAYILFAYFVGVILGALLEKWLSRT